MIEGECPVDPDVPLRLKMAGRAAGGNTAPPALVKMTYEALHVRDRHMEALDDLGMACRAAELLLAPHLFYMAGVAEEDVLEDHLVLQVSPLVAALLETARIIYLGMGLRGAFSRDEVDERQLAVLPLPSYVVGEARFVVALDAVDVPVTRGLPRIDVNLHIVAQATEEGRLGDLEQAYNDDDKTEKNEGEKNHYPLLVLEGTPLRLRVEIPEERLNQPVKATDPPALSCAKPIIFGADG